MTIWKILKWKYYSTVLNTSWARFCQWTTGFYIFHLLYLMTLPFFLISGFVTNWCYGTFIKYLRPLMFNIPRAEFLVLPYFPVSENGSVMSLVVRLHHAFLFISQFNSSTAFRFSKCRKKSFYPVFRMIYDFWLNFILLYVPIWIRIISDWIFSPSSTLSA